MPFGNHGFGHFIIKYTSEKMQIRKQRSRTAWDEPNKMLSVHV
jgi:hypothetical protein